MFGSSNVKFGITFCLLLLCDNTLPIHIRKANSEVYCDRIESQRNYSLSDMSGDWYGIEILEHVMKGRPAADSCIRVQIKEIDSNNVELIWRERNIEVVYRFVILNPADRGVWTSQGPQIVTGRLGYEQFAGNVVVQKASETNVVLTFCSQPHILYSLVLSKAYTMNETELGSIHRMVERFGASAVEVKKFCRNRAASPDSVAMLLVLCLINVFIMSLRGR